MSSKKVSLCPSAFAIFKKMFLALYRHQKMKWGFDLIRPNWDIFERRMWNILTITPGKETHHQKVCLFKKKVQRAFFWKLESSQWLVTSFETVQACMQRQRTTGEKNHSLKLKDLKKKHTMPSPLIESVVLILYRAVASAANKPEGGTSKRLLQIYVIDFKTTGLFRVYFLCCMPCESSAKRMGPITGSYYSLGSCGWQ